MITLARRSLLAGLFCAPAIVRASSLMAIKPFTFETNLVYGLSPGMQVLSDIRELNAITAAFYREWGALAEQITPVWSNQFEDYRHGLPVPS